MAESGLVVHLWLETFVEIIAARIAPLGVAGLGSGGLPVDPAAFGDDNPFLADFFDPQHSAHARQPVAGTNFVKPAGAALHERYAVLDLSHRIIANRLRGVGGFGVRAAGGRGRSGAGGATFAAGLTLALASLLAVAGADDLAEIAASSRPMDLSFFSSLASICAATLAASAWLASIFRSSEFSWASRVPLSGASFRLSRESSLA